MSDLKQFEEFVLQCMTEIGGRKITEIDLESNIFDLIVDSVSMMVLIGKIEAAFEFELKVDINQLLRGGSIKYCLSILEKQYQAAKSLDA